MWTTNPQIHFHMWSEIRNISDTWPCDMNVNRLGFMWFNSVRQNNNNNNNSDWFQKKDEEIVDTQGPYRNPVSFT